MQKFRALLLMQVKALLFSMMSCCSAAWGGESITMGWDPDPDTNVVGYVIYYGTNSGQYVYRVDAGANLSVTLTNLQAGLKYYFAVTAYNAQRVESVPSGEITYLVPGILLLSAGVKTSDPMIVKFPVAQARWYELQASVDLRAWGTIWQITNTVANDWVQYADAQSTLMARRFYRLVLH